MTAWRSLAAPAKLNLALVVGPRRVDGKHEVVTVLERLELHDTVSVRRSAETRVTGFADDTLVGDALEAIAELAGGASHFEARIEKRIPVAAGLGGGSSDAAAALLLANDLLDTRLPSERLHAVAAALGADVPFFLHDGPRLGTGDGTVLEPAVVPRGYAVLLALPAGAGKPSTREVYAAFDERGGEHGFARRRDALYEALAGLRSASDLASLPANDLASPPLTGRLRDLGAFRADVTGAGPVVYGLFADEAQAALAAAALEDATTWLTAPG